MKFFIIILFAGCSHKTYYHVSGYTRLSGGIISVKFDSGRYYMKKCDSWSNYQDWIGLTDKQVKSIFK